MAAPSRDVLLLWLLPGLLGYPSLDAFAEPEVERNIFNEMNFEKEIGSFRVGWQEHSKNDIRGWPQMLLKGGRSFKIDPNFQSKKFCMKQENVKKRAEKVDDRGCFVLNHDTPDLFSNRPDYNTTDDMLDFIADKKYSMYFGPEAKENFPGVPFRFALCFKNSPSACGASKNSENWRGLIDELYESAQKLVGELDLHVEFVLDGDVAGGNICNCFRDRWRPWVSTYIPGGGQAPGSCINDAFNSTNSTLGYDRYQILNTRSSSFEWAASQKFGRFPSSSYPYQIYEPKDQSEISQRISDFVSAPAPPHSPGLDFAINIDSAMFEVYASDESKAAKFARSWSKKIIANAFQPILLILPVEDNSLWENNLIIIFYTSRAGLTSSYSIFEALNGIGSNLTLVGSGSIEGNHGGCNVISASSLDQRIPNSKGIIIRCDSGRLVAYSVRKVYDSFELVPGAIIKDHLFQIDVSLDIQGDTGVDADIMSDCPIVRDVEDNPSDDVISICTAQLAVNKDRNLVLRLWKIRMGKQGGAITEVLSDKVIQTVSYSQGLSICSLGYTSSPIGEGSTESASSVALTWADSGTVYASIARWNNSDEDFAVDAKAFIGHGKYPKVSHLKIPYEASVDDKMSKESNLLLLTHGWGYCQNTEPRNKAASKSVCEIPRQSSSAPTNESNHSQGALIYSYGFLSDVERKLRKNEPMTACDSCVMHGAYGLGGVPSAKILLRKKGFSILGVHEGYTGTSGDPQECGEPKKQTEDTIVLSAWKAADIHMLNDLDWGCGSNHKQGDLIGASNNTVEKKTGGSRSESWANLIIFICTGIACVLTVFAIWNCVPQPQTRPSPFSNTRSDIAFIPIEL